jgi:hypothetical protein
MFNPTKPLRRALRSINEWTLISFNAPTPNREQYSSLIIWANNGPNLRG